MKPSATPGLVWMRVTHRWILQAKDMLRKSSSVCVITYFSLYQFITRYFHAYYSYKAPLIRLIHVAAMFMRIINVI